MEDIAAARSVPTTPQGSRGSRRREELRVTLDEEPDHSGSFGLPSTTYIGSVTAGGGSVYWSIEVTCRNIRATSSGAQKTTIVHAVTFPTQLTLDHTHVYFLAGGGQTDSPAPPG